MPQTYAPVSMPIPKPRLSEFLAPEEPGKIYIGPNINWPRVPGLLSELLTLADPSGMMGGPVGFIPKVAKTEAAQRTVMNPNFKKYMDEILKTLIGLERDPGIKRLAKDTIVEFGDPLVKIPLGVGTGRRIASTNPQLNVIKFLDAMSHPKYTEMPEEALKKFANLIATHEVDHLINRNPKLFNKVIELYAKAPDDLKSTIEGVIRPNSPISAAAAEFFTYGREALRLGDEAVSGVGQTINRLAKLDPKVQDVLKELSNIRLEAAEDLSKVIKRGTNSDYIIKEVRDLIKEEQRKIIPSTTKAGKIVGTRQTAPRQLPEVTEKEILKEAPKARKRIKTYTPKEKSEGVSIRPMYTDPQKVSNEEFIEDVLKNIKNQEVRESVSMAIREAFEKRQP